MFNLFFKKEINLDDLFKNFDNRIKQLFKPTYKKLSDKFYAWRKNPIVINELKRLNTVDTKLERYEILYNIIKSFLQDNTVRNLIFKILEILLNNLKDIIASIPIIDKELYNSLTKFITTIRVKDEEDLEEIIILFAQDFFEGISILTIIESILIFQEEKDFDEILENASKIDYKKFISDWTLKYAQIIEGPLKNVLLIILKFKYISQGKKFRHFDGRDLSIGQILKRLNSDIILANYRNAIFHQNIYLTKEHEIKFNKIILRDRGKKIILSLEEYINEFNKVLFFLANCYIVLFETYLDFSLNTVKLKNKILSSFKILINRFISSSYKTFSIDLKN